jgi:TolA-binding protein
MMNRYSKHVLYGVCLSAVLVFCADAALAQRKKAPSGIPGRILKTNRTSVQGYIRWKPASRIYEVTTQDRKVFTIPAREVVDVITKEPKELRAAKQQIQRGGNPARAIGALEAIGKKYRNMGWDVVANRWIAEARYKNGQKEEALKILRKVKASNRDAMREGGFAKLYCKVLIETGNTAELNSVLTQIVRSGDRSALPLAQILRGDLEMKAGNYKIALLDGYLRTVILFRDAKEERPEALYKAAKCFTELGEMSNAQRMKKMLMAEFPRHEYSKKLQSGT